MNEIERRTLLGAAGIGALAAIAKAGPLDPPAGALSPTGRTLDEIYNKIPSVGGSDGRIPVNTPGSILSPGSYVLTGNLIVSGSITTIFIATSNVTLDLNGFRVGNTGSTGACIALIGAVSNVTIRNGSTVNGESGVFADGGLCRGILIENVRVYNPRLTGIVLANAAARDCVIRRCEVCECGIASTAVDVSAPVIGIGYNGSAGRIEECTVHTLANNGTGTVTSRGVYTNNVLGTGNLVANCHLGNNGGVAGIGINNLAASTVYRNNAVSGYSTPYSGGVNGGGNA